MHRNSGKTVAGAAELLSWGFGEELWSGKAIDKIGNAKWKPGMRFFIGAKDFAGGHNEVILPKIMELLPLEEIGVEFIKMSGRITHKLRFPEPYNFSVKLLSYDQEMHKSEGMTWNGGWFDEPPPRHMYVSCRRGCMRHAAPVIFTGTPLEEAWMYDEIFAAPDSVHVEKEEDLKRVKWNTKAITKFKRGENPHITEEQIQAYEDTLDEEEKAARIYGEFLHLQGRVYKGFDRTKHVLPTDKFFVDHPDWKKYPGFCVIDPHDRKPFAIAWGVVTPRDETVFIDEWPHFDFVKQKSWKWDIGEYAAMMKSTEANLWGTIGEGAAAGLAEYGKPNIVWRIMDPNFGRTPKAGTARTVVDEFELHDFYFETTVDDDVSSGHLAVKSDLAANRLFVLDRCTNIIKGMENYTWDEYRGGKDRSPKERSRDKYKDFPDLVRYARKYPVEWFDQAAMLTYMRPAGFENSGMGRRRF